MKTFLSLMLICVAMPAFGQAIAPSADGAATLAAKPFDLGVFAEGGLGTSQDKDTHFFSFGGRAGWVVAGPMAPGVLRGQPEVAVELYPFWQAYTPVTSQSPHVGGTFTGVSVTPVNLRWNFTSGQRFIPWFQGAGGVIWTSHKFPAGPTSVWNFSPQFGIGAHYFLSNKRSLDFSANAVHISSASLGDHNPGINAAVMFTAGYSWWK